MQIVYTLSCGISYKHHKFFINMKHGAKDVIKMIYQGQNQIQPSSIIQSDFIQNHSNKYIVIGSKSINEKEIKHKYHEVGLVTDEGLWNRYWQEKFDAFMEKYKISFEYLPMLIVRGYHFNNGIIQNNKKYTFKINNLTSGIQYLKTNEYAQVQSKKGISKFLITDIIKTNDVRDVNNKSLTIKNLHDLKKVVHITNCSLNDLKHYNKSDLSPDEIKQINGSNEK